MGMLLRMQMVVEVKECSEARGCTRKKQTDEERGSTRTDRRHALTRCTQPPSLHEDQKKRRLAPRHHGNTALWQLQHWIISEQQRALGICIPALVSDEASFDSRAMRRAKCEKWKDCTDKGGCGFDTGTDWAVLRKQASEQGKS